MARIFKPRHWKGLLECLRGAVPACEAVGIFEGDRALVAVPEGKVPEAPPALELEFGFGLRLRVWGDGVGEWRPFFEAYLSLLDHWLKTEESRRAVTDEALKRYRELSYLHHIASNLINLLDEKEVASQLLERAGEACRGVSHGGLLGLERGGARVLALWKETTEELALRLAGTRLFREIARSGQPEIINGLSRDPRLEGEEIPFSCIMVVPIRTQERFREVLFLGRNDPFSSIHLKSIASIVAIGATALANARHFQEIKRTLEAAFLALATAIDSRDLCTAGHSRRVADYALKLAEAVNEDQEFFPEVHFSEEEKQELYYAALLHDVGKIGVREEVLNKSSKLAQARLEVVKLRLELMASTDCLLLDLPLEEVFARLEKINRSGFLSEEDRRFIEELARKKAICKGKEFPILTEEEKEALLIPRGNLSASEWQEIRKHPRESQRILEQIPFPDYWRDLVTIVAQHHEKLDGSGYPHGLRQGDIKLQSRILAVCDIYDALTAADRPYKKAMPVEKAVEILRLEAREGKLDPRVVEIFVKKVLGQE